MKAKDLILEINKLVNSNELSALAGSSAFQDIEVQDDTLKEVQTKLSGLMTPEAARNNPELSEYFKKQLHPTIKGEILGNIDTDILQKSKTLFGDESVKEFEGIEYTGDKIKKVFELAQKTISSKSTDEKLKKVNDDLKKQLEEISNNFQTQLSEKETQLKQKDEEFKGKLIQNEFMKTLSNYKLGEKYSDDFIKESLYNKMFTEVQKKAKLVYNENGQIALKRIDNPELDFYDGNKKVDSIKELLDPLMEPYIDKQPAKPGPNGSYKPTEDKPKLSALAESFIRKKQELKNEN